MCYSNSRQSRQFNFKTMKYLKLFALFLLISCYETADLQCGSDWEPYKDEKCIRVLDQTTRTFADAEKACAQLDNNPTLPVIHSAEEQSFISNYLFKTQKKVNNFWIGAKFDANGFKWVDNSTLSFTNWDTKGPRNKANYCVEMEADEALVGKWLDEPCGKVNFVVCEKLQTWSIARLQKTLLDARKELRDSQEDARSRIKSLEQSKAELSVSLGDAKNHIKLIEQNPVPIGFIYIQLPNQPEPKSIWPIAEWGQITAEYAGLFFRAEGAGSATFGTEQTENSPRLIQVEFKIGVTQNKAIGVPATNQWSDFVSTGGTSQADGLRFIVSNGEVRPRNKAVRIWKRTK